MSSKTLVADDFDAIRQRLAELEADKKPAEEPKAWPMYAAAETAKDEAATYLFSAAPQWTDLFKGPPTKIGAQLRIRLPKDFYSA